VTKLKFKTTNQRENELEKKMETVQLTHTNQQNSWIKNFEEIKARWEG
jgi:hypothetical protein